MKALIEEYKITLKQLENSREDLTKEQSEVLSGMISDLRYAIDWMSTGRSPQARRGIERQAAYQRERPVDPITIQKFVRSTADEYSWTDIQEEECITEWDKIRIDDALSVLTAREKEIYLMVRGYLLSYEEAAKMLVLSKSTIQKVVERAEKKIKSQITQSLFAFDKNCINL